MRYPLLCLCPVFVFLFCADLFSQNAAFYSDIHMHSSFGPFNSREIQDSGLWDTHCHSCPDDNKQLSKSSKGIPKESQSNLMSCIQGNVKLAYLSLIPMEYEMRHPRLVKKPKKKIPILACMAGCHVNLDFFETDFIDYYDDLRSHIQYVIDEQQETRLVNGKEYSFEIIKTRQQFERVLKDPLKIGIMLSIEGGHSLGHSPMKSRPFDSPEYEEIVMANVDRLKGIAPWKDNSTELLEYPVWFLTLNHFMWNGLSGHARTFSDKQSVVFNQNKNMNSGLTPLGEKVISRLLDRKNGRRILVDVKHMSLESRKWYYDFVRKQRILGDPIPILASHTGISGRSWYDEVYQQKDKDKKNKDSHTNLWTLNLADEDVREIYASNGLIGIMLDKYRISGERTKEMIDSLPELSEERRELYVKIIAANMLEVVDAVRTKAAWDIISIGSDFDGMVNAFEHYENYSNFPQMERDLVAFFENPKDIFDLFTVAQIEHLKFGYSGEELVAKVMGKNAADFTLRILEEDFRLAH